jgi:hypothetical protein
MNPVASYKSLKSNNSDCSDFMTLAEREFSAFFRAVQQLFGSEQAERSAEDWLHELIESEGLPGSAREWRLITARVIRQLAGRVNTASFSISNA